MLANLFLWSTENQYWRTKEWKKGEVGLILLLEKYTGLILKGSKRGGRAHSNISLSKSLWINIEGQEWRRRKVVSILSLLKCIGLILSGDGGRDRRCLLNPFLWGIESEAEVEGTYNMTYNRQYWQEGKTRMAGMYWRDTISGFRKHTYSHVSWVPLNRKIIESEGILVNRWQAEKIQK